VCTVIELIFQENVEKFETTDFHKQYFIITMVSAKINEGVNDDEDFGIEFGDTGEVVASDNEIPSESEKSESDDSDDD